MQEHALQKLTRTWRSAKPLRLAEMAEKKEKECRSENRVGTLMADVQLPTLVLTQSGSRTTGNLIHPTPGKLSAGARLAEPWHPFQQSTGAPGIGM